MQLVNNIYNNLFINRNIIWKDVKNTSKITTIKSFEDDEYSFIIKVECLEEDLKDLYRYYDYCSYYKKHIDFEYKECDFIISPFLRSCEMSTERFYMFLILNNKNRYFGKKRNIKYFSLKYATS